MKGFLSLPKREEKPRESGITHVLDRGLGLNAVEDMLNTSGDYIDIVKLGWGTGYITQRTEKKVELYQEHRIPVCFGGTLLEVAIAQGKFNDCLSWLNDMGVTHIEVSNGTISLDLKEKLSYIQRLRESNFTVLSEIGRKNPDEVFPATEWVECIKKELEVGAWKVITEARESGTVGIYSSDKKVKEALIAAIAEEIPIDKLIFEAPDKSQQVWFIKRFGSNVNLGNIPSAEVIPLETLRLGLRGDTLIQFLQSE